MPIDLLLSADWVVPVEPAGALPDHALAIHAGCIVDLAPTAEALARHRPAEHLHLPGHALLPGFVNAHTHAAMSLLRGIADDLPLMTWLQEHIWPAEGRWLSEDFVRDGTRLALAEMIRGGTTTFNDMYLFPEVTARCVQQAGLRACIGLVVLDFPTPWARDADEYLRKGLALHDELKGDPLLRTALAPHAPYTVGDGPLQRIVTLANELDLPVHMHVHETADEVRTAEREQGRRPLARLEALGLLGPALMAVHMTQLTAREIALVAERGVHVVHCPQSNLKLASGLCPVRELRAAGVNVALGTDGAASNNDLDMLGELRSAALLAKGVSGDARAVPAAEALAMATLHGARALGLADEIGSLQPGKAADVIAIDLARTETTPCYDPVSAIVYAAGREAVRHVWVAGRPLLRERRLTTLDEAEVQRRARHWAARISAADAAGT